MTITPMSRFTTIHPATFFGGAIMIVGYQAGMRRRTLNYASMSGWILILVNLGDITKKFGNAIRVPEDISKLRVHNLGQKDVREWKAPRNIAS